MQIETAIWGLAPNQTESHMEDLLASGKLSDNQIKAVTDAAEKAGFHHIRIAKIDLSVNPWAA